jgi:hypothetical protein
VKAQGSYTWAKLYIRVTVNATTTDSTVRSRKGGANGNQLITIGAGLTGTFTDDVNSDALVAGNLYNVQVTAGAVGNITITIVGSTLTAATNIPPLVANDPSGSSIGAGATPGYAMGGRFTSSDNETRVQYSVQTAKTLSNFRIYIESNTRADDTTYSVQINLANGNQVITVPAAATGSFEDADGDAVAVGQTVIYLAVAGAGAGSIKCDMKQMLSTCIAREMVLQGSWSIPFNTSAYLPVEGDGDNYAAAEVNVQCAARTAFTARNLFMLVPTNTLNGASTYSVRRNGASVLSVNIPAGTTGIFTNLVTTADFVATDLIDQLVTTGGAVGLLGGYVMGFDQYQPSAAASGSIVPIAVGAGMI